MSIITGIIDALRDTIGSHDDIQESHVAETQNDASKLKTSWNTPNRDLGNHRQWQYRGGNERDNNSQRKETGYAVIGYGRYGQALGKSWGSCSEYVSMLNQAEKDARAAQQS
mmetsp:Transcript_25170/g.37029  ORF Transcript_25170/g.37029 Transcript_25170/m.37029 type:complete len:112 (+) Transcript_25170:71-406(+)|eukprot:CAMPEP_0195525764 /NCGR_PEP_ID=MMETSP0794_2-20130614/26373_1 /TAXON_ID=515487 /ORGANISM="Stephanopyxis turris, Strain CCMP 815" /LENGTH=111 /DNA_ID=CAMNT_0040656295 /DNA_START=60 /DNA_END=395 /DNA_ORIENTATION=-